MNTNGRQGSSERQRGNALPLRILLWEIQLFDWLQPGLGVIASYDIYTLSNSSRRSISSFFCQWLKKSRVINAFDFNCLIICVFNILLSKMSTCLFSDNTFQQRLVAFAESQSRRAWSNAHLCLFSTWTDCRSFLIDSRAWDRISWLHREYHDTRTTSWSFLPYRTHRSKTAVIEAVSECNSSIWVNIPLGSFYHNWSIQTHNYTQFPR